MTDLDGTLITEQQTDKCKNILVLETAHGKSYISENNLKKLHKIAEKADIVPLTTRSESSFKKFNVGIDFKYALIENGACFVKNGNIDDIWKEESKKLLEQGKKSENICRKYLEGHGYVVKSSSTFVIDYINNHTTMSDTEKCFNELVELVGDDFDVALNSVGQIYAVYKKLRKDENLKRFLQKYKYDKIITCGDSFADYGMLKDHIGIGLSNSPARYKFSLQYYKTDNHTFTDFALTKTLWLIDQLQKQ